MKKPFLKGKFIKICKLCRQTNDSHCEIYLQRLPEINLINSASGPKIVFQGNYLPRFSQMKTPLF